MTIGTIFRAAAIVGLAAAAMTTAASAQPIQSVDELVGWWTHQDYQTHPFQQCSDPDGDGRVAIGRTKWNEEKMTLEFVDEGPMGILFYEGGCDFAEAMASGGKLAVSSECSAEGEDYSGFTTFERIDPYTIKVQTPVMDRPIVLASCRVDHSQIPNPKPAGKLPYGSRAGMDVTVLGASALDTSAARVYIEHTMDDARAFCMEYVMTIEPECIERTMKEAEAFPRSVAADCTTGYFKTIGGTELLFAGKDTKPGAETEYILYGGNVSERLDGSSASGYGEALAIFSALCPSKVEG